MKPATAISPDYLKRPVTGRGFWALDPKVTFLNHGAFGACPQPVLRYQTEMRRRMERQPLRFLVRELEPLLDQARQTLADFVGAEAENLVFVPNASTGVNTVLRSLTFRRSDELLVTDHEYNASRNALDFVAERTGARVVVVPIPFPLRSADEITQAILAKVTARTRLALIDHVTSQTGVIFPVAKLVREFSARGVETLVDGAHAPGMVPLNLQRLGATYYTGNCHKWLCAPKGAAFLHVQRDRQPLIRPLVISHGANSARTDRSRYQIEFGWAGTWDPSAYLAVPEAIRQVGAQLPGGWPAVQARNHALVVAARRVICEALGVAAPCPESMLGTLVAIPLPPLAANQVPPPPLFLDPLQDELLFRHRLEVPIIPWPARPGRLLRVAAQLYNSLPQYARLAQVLQKKLTSR